jgi:hypothetical protein
VEKSPKRCAWCHGRIGLISYHHRDLRFCRKIHIEAFLKREEEQREQLKRWLVPSTPHPQKVS